MSDELTNILANTFLIVTPTSGIADKSPSRFLRSAADCEKTSRILMIVIEKAINNAIRAAKASSNKAQ